MLYLHSYKRSSGMRAEPWIHIGILVEDVSAGLCAQSCIPLHHIWCHPDHIAHSASCKSKMMKPWLTIKLLSDSRHIADSSEFRMQKDFDSGCVWQEGYRLTRWRLLLVLDTTCLTACRCPVQPPAAAHAGYSAPPSRTDTLQG